ERRGRTVRPPGREGGGIDDGGGGEADQFAPQPVGGGGVLERGGEGADGGEAARAQRRDQRVDGIGIGGGQVGAVEGDDGKRPVIGPGGSDTTLPGSVPAEGRDGLVARHRSGIEPGRQRQLLQRGLRRD